MFFYSPKYLVECRFIFEFLLVLGCTFCHPIANKISAESKEPHEVQFATCKIVTKEIEASAKATVTRRLKGVCSSREFNSKFNLLLDEIRQIKQTLLHLTSHPFNRDVNSSPSSFIITSSSTTALPLYEDYPDFDESASEIRQQEQGKLEKKKHIALLAVMEEISVFNDTIVESSEGPLYFYYWKITDVVKLLNRRDSYISSPKFVVLGHTLKMQFYPNYLGEYIGIVLKPESASFLKKHKIFVLGQRDEESNISSGVLYGIRKEDKMFNILPEMLGNNFVFNNTLILKVKIYLSS